MICRCAQAVNADEARFQTQALQRQSDIGASSTPGRWKTMLVPLITNLRHNRFPSASQWRRSSVMTAQLSDAQCLR